MESKGYFSIKQDSGIVATGSFWCSACLCGKPLDDQSPDPRYCLGCYDFLLEEARLYGASKPSWIPKAKEPEIMGEKSIKVSGDMRTIMSTVNDKKTKVDIIPSQTSKVTHGKRGPKHRDLPLELVKQLAGQGLGSKAIVSRLKAEKVDISYKTVQRILSGERKQL